MLTVGKHYKHTKSDLQVYICGSVITDCHGLAYVGEGLNNPLLFRIHPDDCDLWQQSNYKDWSDYWLGKQPPEKKPYRPLFIAISAN